jgi:AcrR family transcriptional regulator
MGRRPQVTRSDVLRASREVFSERGYEGATLTMIAARLGVSPAALLRHAPTKEALFSAAMTPVETTGPLPMEFLRDVNAATEDPAKMLRKLASEFVPFIEQRLGENIARWLHARTSEEALTLRLPFDPRIKQSPPERGLAIVEDYFRRASAAGRMCVRNPRAAALAFLGSLHAYVFLQKVLQIFDSSITVDLYIQTLMDVWTGGAIRKASGQGLLRPGKKRRVRGIKK